MWNTVTAILRVCLHFEGELARDPERAPELLGRFIKAMTRAAREILAAVAVRAEAQDDDE